MFTLVDYFSFFVPIQLFEQGSMERCLYSEKRAAVSIYHLVCHDNANVCYFWFNWSTNPLSWPSQWSLFINSILEMIDWPTFERDADSLTVHHSKAASHSKEKLSRPRDSFSGGPSIQLALLAILRVNPTLSFFWQPNEGCGILHRGRDN